MLKFSIESDLQYAYIMLILPLPYANPTVIRGVDLIVL